MRLSRMLLEVALDLDAEAEAMEASGPADEPAFRRMPRSNGHRALLHTVASDTDTRPVQLTNLSFAGARFRADRIQTPGCKVILELPGHALRLAGTVLGVRGTAATMRFEPASSADPALRRLLQSETQSDRIWA
ncbi:MAG: hypothetical protein ABSC06_08840 [Rhodopila sp.]